MDAKEKAKQEAQKHDAITDSAVADTGGTAEPHRGKPTGRMDVLDFISGVSFDSGVDDVAQVPKICLIEYSRKMERKLGWDWDRSLEEWEEIERNTPRAKKDFKGSSLLCLCSILFISYYLFIKMR